MWRQAGEQGFLGLEVPEEFGGSQADDYRFNMVFAEELAKVSMGLNSSMQIHFDICAPYLVDLGTTELKTRLLPDFAAGEKVAGIMTEAGAELISRRSRPPRSPTATTGSSTVQRRLSPTGTPATSSSLPPARAREGPAESRCSLSKRNARI